MLFAVYRYLHSNVLFELYFVLIDQRLKHSFTMKYL